MASADSVGRHACVGSEGALPPHYGVRGARVSVYFKEIYMPDGIYPGIYFYGAEGAGKIQIYMKAVFLKPAFRLSKLIYLVYHWYIIFKTI